MSPTSRIRRRLPSLVPLTVFVSLLVAGSATAHEHGAGPPADQPRDAEHSVCTDAFRKVKGQGLSCHTRNGLWKVKLRRGGEVLTHGGDPAPAFIGRTGRYAVGDLARRQPVCATTNAFHAILATAPDVA